jgi:hypothetical protein
MEKLSAACPAKSRPIPNARSIRFNHWSWRRDLNP